MFEEFTTNLSLKKYIRIIISNPTKETNLEFINLEFINLMTKIIP